MTNYIEEQLMAGMRDEVAGTVLSTDILGAAVRGHQRRTVLRRAVFAAGVVGLAGVAAVAVTLSGTGAGAGGPQGDGRPAAVAAGTPELRLASAITASQNTTYRIKVTIQEGKSRATTNEGAFDPATSTGYLNSQWAGSGPVYYERLVAGIRYVGSSGSPNWKQDPRRYDRLTYDTSAKGHDPAAKASGATANPDELLAELRKAGTKITESGGKFHFEVTLKPEKAPRTTLKQSIAGDITLDGDQRISSIAYTRTSRATKDGISETSTTTVRMAFSGYGAPVKVEKPAKVDVVK